MVQWAVRVYIINFIALQKKAMETSVLMFRESPGAAPALERVVSVKEVRDSHSARAPQLVLSVYKDLITSFLYPSAVFRVLANCPTEDGVTGIHSSRVDCVILGC
jgi:hypothetical protein